MCAGQQKEHSLADSALGHEIAQWLVPEDGHLNLDIEQEYLKTAKNLNTIRLRT